MFLMCPAHSSRGLFVGAHSVAALSQLQALTRLGLRGAHYQAVSSGVVQLQQLRHLSIRSMELLTPADVVSLVQLKTLTALECRHIRHDRACLEGSPGYCLPAASRGSAEATKPGMIGRRAVQVLKQ